MIIFFILSIGIAGNTDAGIETPMLIWILEIITGFLTIGKIIFVSKGE